MAASVKKLSIVQVDVFTDRALAGNALAVVLDGRGLGTEQMQALARETNLSETTFILPGEAAAEEARGIRVRIFTVQEELPFAGHPTLGTAFVLRGQSTTPFARDPNGKNKLNLTVTQVSLPITVTVVPRQVGIVTVAPGTTTIKVGQQAEVLVKVTRLHDFNGEFKVQLVAPGENARRSTHNLCSLSAQTGG